MLPANRSKLLDSIEEPAFDLFRLFVLAHRIGVILHLYRPGSRSLFRFFSLNKYGRAYRWWTVMNHCCRVPRDRIRMIHRRFCTRCHVILPFRTHCHFILQRQVDHPEICTLIRRDFRCWRCHFMLQAAAILCFKAQRGGGGRRANALDPIFLIARIETGTIIWPERQKTEASFGQESRGPTKAIGGPFPDLTEGALYGQVPIGVADRS